MNAAYPYNPTVHDLFLYEDITLSVELPSPTTIAAKQAVAWNPNSWLYGYRNSLHGFGISYRQFTTNWALVAPNVNNPTFTSQTSPETHPIWYRNCFPPAMHSMGSRFFYTCAHCHGGEARNNALRWVPNYYAAGYDLAALCKWRFISPSNTVTEVSATQLLPPYDTDPDFPNLHLREGMTAGGKPDIVMTETQSPHGIPSVTWGAAQNAGYTAKCWAISNNGIVFKADIASAEIKQTLRWSNVRLLQQDGTTSTIGNFLVWSFDSFSSVWMEVKPPTSVAAGDGILACLTGHVATIGIPFPYSAYYGVIIGGDSFDFDAYGEVANGDPTAYNYLPEYMQFRGHQSPTVLPVRRQVEVGVANQTDLDDAADMTSALAERFLA